MNQVSLGSKCGLQEIYFEVLQTFGVCSVLEQCTISVIQHFHF